MPTTDVHSTLQNGSVGGYGILPSVVINHPLSQPPTHSLDRSVNQTNQSTKRRVNQSIVQSTNHSVHYPLSHSTDQSIKQISQPNDGSINQSIVQSTNHSVHQLFNQSTTDSSTLSECVRRLLETCYLYFHSRQKKDPPSLSPNKMEMIPTIDPCPSAISVTP